MTKPEYDAAVLEAYARFAFALLELEAHRLREEKLEEDVKSAEGELRALARRRP
jgi:hypothetical protein